MPDETKTETPAPPSREKLAASLADFKNNTGEFSSRDIILVLSAEAILEMTKPGEPVV